MYRLCDDSLCELMMTTKKQKRYAESLGFLQLFFYTFYFSL